MAWFVLARVLFIAAVGYSAYQLQPLGRRIPSSTSLSVSSSAA